MAWVLFESQLCPGILVERPTFLVMRIVQRQRRQEHTCRQGETIFAKARPMTFEPSQLTQIKARHGTFIGVSVGIFPAFSTG